MKEQRTLVDEARRLAPALRERSTETNELRRLPDATWKELIKTGLLRGLQPSRWGGGEVNPKEFYNAVIEVARVEGSTGWVLGVVGVHPWQTALFPKETQEEMWSEDPTVMNSSSYAPTGTAEKVPGGYRLSGRWSFSSGCDHCQWVNLGAIPGTVKVEGKEVPDFRSFLLPQKDYKIDDNWFVAGMAGTGSKDIIVEDTFVPEHRSQAHWDYTLGRPLPGWELNPSPLYRLPWVVVFVSTLAASTLGVALGFLDVWTEISRTRKGSLGLNVKEDPYIQKLLAEASYTINTGILRLYHDSEEMMEAARAGEPYSLKRQAALRYNACRSAQLAVQAVDCLFEASSGRATFFNHPLQRRYQDVKAMMGHVGLKPDVPARMYGAMEFGLFALEFPF